MLLVFSEENRIHFNPSSFFRMIASGGVIIKGTLNSSLHTHFNNNILFKRHTQCTLLTTDRSNNYKTKSFSQNVMKQGGTTEILLNIIDIGV